MTPATIDPAGVAAGACCIRENVRCAIDAFARPDICVNGVSGEGIRYHILKVLCHGAESPIGRIAFRTNTTGNPTMSTSPTDVTLDATPAPADSSGSKPKVHMVAGSGPQLDCETRDIRRKRLQVSSLVLCLAFGAFFVWRIVADFVLHIPKFTLNDSMSLWLWISHGAIIALLAVSALNLCRRCALSVFSLLAMEFVVFGSPVVFLAMMQFATLPLAVEEHNMMSAITPPWLLMTYVYALFIPNCWRRSLPAIGTYCAMPILVLGLLGGNACRVSTLSHGQPDDPGRSSAHHVDCCHFVVDWRSHHQPSPP